MWNDGALPKEVPLEKLFKEHISKPCNPNLANIFFKCGMIESWGRGFEKIVNYCKEKKAKVPEIDLSLGGVTARCFASELYLKLMKDHEKEFSGKNEGLNDPINELENLVLEIIKKNPAYTYSEIARQIGKSEATVKRTLSILKKAGVIERDGSKKTGHWIIVK